MTRPATSRQPARPLKTGRAFSAGVRLSYVLNPCVRRSFRRWTELAARADIRTVSASPGKWIVRTSISAVPAAVSWSRKNLDGLSSLGANRQGRNRPEKARRSRSGSVWKAPCS